MIARRRKPYTSIGIRRLKCFRCTRRAEYQWNACSDKSFRPICTRCDVALNALVLRWMRHPDAAQLIAAYRKEKLQ